MTESPDRWPDNLCNIPPNSNLEAKLILPVNHSTTQKFDPLEKLISNCSSWRKLLFVLSSSNKLVNALQVKFKNSHSKYTNINIHDLNFVESQLIKYVQSLQFLDEILALLNKNSISTKSKLQYSILFLKME